MASEPSNQITISARGSAIAANNRSETHQLKIDTRDPTARIVVLDGQFKAIAKANGAIEGRFPSGIYKIRVQRGASSIGFEDKVVVLDRDTEILVEPPQLSTPSPLGGTSAIGSHVAACEWLDAVVHVGIGRGAKLAVLARYGEPQQEEAPLHPFRGLQLLRENGERLVDLEIAAPKTSLPSQEPVAICGIAVDPGAYIIRYRLAGGRQVSQSLIACAGWQTTLNIRRVRSIRNPDEKSLDDPQVSTGTLRELFAQPGYVSILMRRMVNWQSADRAARRPSAYGIIDDDRLTEVARQGLADGTEFLSGNLYDLMLRDFENPLVGILGGILLDVERVAQGEQFCKEHEGFFDILVARLREMVGSSHPDVEALAFRCRDSALVPKRPFRARPMFHRSWRLILEAAATRHDIVPIDLWKRTSASGSMPPFLIWTADRTYKRNRLKTLTRTISNLLDRGQAEGPGAESVTSSLARAAIEMSMPTNVVARLAAQQQKGSARGSRGRWPTRRTPK
ncbi:hypothetical protein BH10PSE6_BH10PSE6_11980 [soil metagenome]